MADPDRIAIARLDGSARRMLNDNTPRDEAIRALRKISTDPDVLTRAAGAALGSWRRDPAIGWQGDKVAGLLVEAGADEVGAQVVADEVVARDRGAGIGNPEL